MKRSREKTKMKRIIDIWKQAGSELEEIRRQKLRGLPYRFSEVNTLLELSSSHNGPLRTTSGLVEMQRIFMKGARRLNKLPSAVRETQARYDVKTAARRHTRRKPAKMNK